MVSDRNSEQTERRATADFEQILQHAELLLSDVDDGHRRIVAIRSVSLVGLTVIILIVALLASFSGNLVHASLALAEGLLSVTAVALVTFSWIGMIRAQLRRDELGMVDLVNVLRELLPLVAGEEKWSYIENKLAVARLERFPIGVQDSGRGRKLR